MATQIRLNEALQPKQSLVLYNTLRLSSPLGISTSKPSFHSVVSKFRYVFLIKQGSFCSEWELTKPLRIPTTDINFFKTSGLEVKMYEPLETWGLRRSAVKLATALHYFICKQTKDGRTNSK